MKRNLSSFVFVTFFAVSFFMLSTFSYGEVTWSGNLDPDNPNDWNSGTHVYIGKTSTGSLSITDGGDVTSGYSYIGKASGPQSSVTVDGVGSSWETSGGLCVGVAYGNGSLSITNGGHVITNTDGGHLTTNDYGFIGDDSSSQGIAIVDGVGSSWETTGALCVGRRGSGSLSITNGGNVISDDGRVGEYYGSQGSVIISGIGSSWDISTGLHVGMEGSGSLSITNGGNVTSDDGRIGNGFWSHGHSPGSVAVDGVGSSWNISYDIYVGIHSRGSLSITNGGHVTSRSGNIGSHSGSVGSVLVDGVDSSWDNSGNLLIGTHHGGSGSLSIANGGNVTVTGLTSTGLGLNGGTGVIIFNDGSLTTGSLLAGSQDLKGTGIINTKGLVAEVDLVFDSTHGANQTFVMNNSSEQNITLNLDVDGSAYLGAGYSGTGSMSVTEGVRVASTDGYIGYKAGSVGSVTVDGVGSIWDNSGELIVGRYGSGSLSITNGGVVKNHRGWIGNYSGSVGSVVVDGVGSSWRNSDDLVVGMEGSGFLSITNGGIVIVDETLIMYSNGDSFVEMSTGGMLALKGHADSSITKFLALVDGSDEIRFWDESINDWSNIINASIGEDYTLEYISDVNDDLYDHTVLTVTAIPEPITMILFALGCLEIRRRKVCVA